MTNFILGVATGMFNCTAVFGYLTYKLYNLFKYGANTMKAKPQVYEAFRQRAELLTEAQAAGPEQLVRVLKMLHFADMAAARRANKLAGEVLADLDSKAPANQIELFEN